MGGFFRAFRCDRKRPGRLPLRFELLEDRTLLSGFATTDYVIFHGHAGGGVANPLGSPSPTGLMPSQIRHAYGFDQIGYDGTGTTIAIVDAYDDPNIANDLHQFDLQFSLPDPVFSKVNQSGGTSMPGRQRRLVQRDRSRRRMGSHHCPGSEDSARRSER